MRWLLALLVAVSLSGCLVEESGSDAAEGMLAATGCPHAERIGVVLWTGTYSANGAAPFEADVEVPECAVDARFEISSTGLGNPNGATVSLSGCGSEGVLGQIGSVQIGNGNDAGFLCGMPAAGPQTFSVETTVAMTGTVTLRMDMVRA